MEVIGDGAEIPLVHANTFATGSSLCKSSLNPDINHFTHVTWCEDRGQLGSNEIVQRPLDACSFSVPMRDMQFHTDKA